MSDATTAAPATPRWLPTLEGATLATILAIAGLTLAGYRFGDSNHGITVPILKRLMDPALYPGDAMVATAEKFPTVFYKALALVLPGRDAIPAAFFVLYVLSIAATLAGAYRIGRWAGGPAAGALALAIAFPIRIGMAGEALYRVAFSHSHLASALTIWAMVFFLEGRRRLPLLMLSLGAYNHLLYSAYVLVPMLLVVLWEAREAGQRRTLSLIALATVPLLPIAAWSIAHGTPMTQEWLDALRLRSSHHSFPSSFGADLPDAAALLALAAMAVSRLGAEQRRLLAFFLLGTALLFVFGTAFTEFWPAKAVLQFQPHRVWRFTMLLLQGVVAAGVVVNYREGGLARISAVVTGTLLFMPGMEPLLPVAVVLQAATTAPELWAQLTAVLALLGVQGWGDRAVTIAFVTDLVPRLASGPVVAAAAVALLIAAGQRRAIRQRQVLAALAVAGTLLWLAPDAYEAARQRWEYGHWRDVQNWVRLHTPRNAALVTPPRDSGFRVFSERTIVGEWKDGTQQYFDDAFVRDWSARMDALGGEGYPKLPDKQLLEIARRYQASYIVLPLRPIRRHLPMVYRNRTYAVYRAEVLAAGAPPPPEIPEPTE